MPRQTKVRISRSDYINAYRAARLAKVDNDSERIAVFMNHILSLKNVKGTAAETALKGWSIDNWKQKISNLRTFLAENTASVDGKVRMIYPKTVEVIEKKEVEVEGEKKEIDVKTQVVKYFLDKEYKTPMPENALNVNYPSLWSRKGNTKRDNSDLINAIESMEGSLVEVVTQKGE